MRSASCVVEHERRHDVKSVLVFSLVNVYLHHRWKNSPIKCGALQVILRKEQAREEKEKLRL